MFSIVTPVYKTEDFIPVLLTEFDGIGKTVKAKFNEEIEVIFPDGLPVLGISLLQTLWDDGKKTAQLVFSDAVESLGGG